MKQQRDPSLQIRLATIAILGLLIALAAAAFLSGRQFKRDSDFIAEDAVPGTIDAHYMRMAVSRSIGWVLAAASARTPASREACLKTVHEADVTFADALRNYESTIRLNPVADRALLEEVRKTYESFRTQRLGYEALLLAGDADGAATFLEQKLIPVFLPAIQSAEELLKYNHGNSIALSGSIRSRVHQLYWVVAVVVVLALACAVVLVCNLTIRRRELGELQESEEKFSKAFRANPSGIAITEVETGRYIEVNDSFCKILGYPPQEVLGFTTLDKGLWTSEEEHSRFIQRLLSGGTLRQQEMQTRTRYGIRKTVSLNAELIELAGRRCIVTLIEDITERKRATEQIEMLKVSIDKHFDAAYWMDPDNRFVYVNDAACTSLGYTREELLGQPVTMVAPMTHPQRLEEVWTQLRSTGFFTGESTHRRKDGSQFPVEIVASYVSFEGREFNCGFARDITERKQLERKQAELAAIVEFSEDAVIGKTLAGIITSWNLGAEKVFGYTAAEAIGQPLLILFPPERRHEEPEILARIAQGETVQHFDTVRVRKDGREIFISATISPLRDATGKVVGASKIARDITARKQADEALRESEARIRVLGDNLPSGMIYQLDMGLDGQERRFTYISAGVEQLHALTAEAAMQDAHALYGQIVEADRQLVAEREAEALAGMQPFLAELRMRLPSGAIRWSLLASAPRRAAQGHVLWDGIELDITTQKQAEAALRENQEQLVLAMDIARLAHWQFNVVSNTVIADEHLFQLLGTTSAQEGGLSMSPEEYIRRFVHPEDAGIVAREVSLGLASRDPHFSRQFEHRILRRDGTERVMLVRCRIHMDAKGRTGRILGTNQDITEQKQAELRIRHLSRVYEVLSDINKTIVREKDPQRMLAEACRVVVDKGEFRMAWIGIHDAASQKVLPVASAGVVDGYMELINVDLRDPERRSGPSARCFLTGEHAICADIAHDPFPAALRAEALQRGYRSSACFPLKAGGRVTGVFALYSGDAGFFGEEELRLLDELALDIGFALEVNEGEVRRRQAEQELRWRTAFFEAQVHSAMDGILVVDSEGRKLLQNRRMNELWKIPPHIADDPDDSPQIQYVLDRVKEPQAFGEKIAHLYAHPDESSGDVIELVDGTLLERYSSPVRGSDGTYYGRVWIFHDVTDYRRKEARFHRLFEADMQGVIFWNPRGEITEANDAYLKLVGFSREEFHATGLQWAAMTPPEYAAADQRALEDIATKGVCTAYEKEFIRKDGVRVPVLIGGARISQSSDEGVAFVLDLTERKKLEAQFLRAQRMESIGTLASGVAHDLNNILTPIMMSVAALRMDISEERRAGLLNTIEASAQRGAQIVKQVLTFGRGMEGEKHPLRMDRLLDEMEQMIRSTFPKEIALECVKGPQLWLVQGDATQLHQVLLNLCVNARDAMPEGGTLRLSATNLDLDASYASMLAEATPGPFVLLEVGDTGTGIPPEILERIFDPFFTTKGLGKGTGLGLSTVHGIVKGHGGLLKVISQPGQGTTFRIYLPAAPDQQAVADAESLALPPPGHGELVLVVDDEPAITHAARTVLEAHGYRVLLAGDATEALVLFTEHAQEVAVVLTDIMMPVMSGVAFLRTLRKIKSTTPVIASTGLGNQAQLSSMKALGIQSVLHKPYSSNTLLRSLHSVLHPKG